MRNVSPDGLVQVNPVLKNGLDGFQSHPNGLVFSPHRYLSSRALPGGVHALGVSLRFNPP